MTDTQQNNDYNSLLNSQIFLLDIGTSYKGMYYPFREAEGIVCLQSHHDYKTHIFCEVLILISLLCLYAFQDRWRVWMFLNEFTLIADIYCVRSESLVGKLDRETQILTQND